MILDFKSAGWDLPLSDLKSSQMGWLTVVGGKTTIFIILTKYNIVKVGTYGKLLLK